MKIVSFLTFALTVCSLTIPPLASALDWDGVVDGKISRIETINETNNYELRVHLGGLTICNHINPTLNTWGYLNSSDPNYKVTVANLMLAYALGKSVTIFTMNDAGVGCHIHYVSVYG